MKSVSTVKCYYHLYDKIPSTCMKRLLANFKSGLLQKIIYECTKHYNYLETHLHLIQTNLRASKLSKTYLSRHKAI